MAWGKTPDPVWNRSISSSELSSLQMASYSAKGRSRSVMACGQNTQPSPQSIAGREREMESAAKKVSIPKMSSAANGRHHNDDDGAFQARDGAGRACFEVAFRVPVGLPLDANAAGIPVPLSSCADDGPVQAATRS